MLPYCDYSVSIYLLIHSLYLIQVYRLSIFSLDLVYDRLDVYHVIVNNRNFRVTWCIFL